MPYQEIGHGPSKHGHAQVVLKCDVCGDKRTTRASMWRKNGLKHVCAKVVTSAEALDARNLPAQLDAVAGTVTDMRSDLRELAGTVETLAEQVKQVLGRIRELEQREGALLRASHGPSIPGQISDTREALRQIVELKPDIEHPAPQANSQSERKAARDAERKSRQAHALELAYLLYPQRTPEALKQLREYRAEVVDLLDKRFPGDADYMPLAELNLKLSKALNNWDSKHFSLAYQLRETDEAPE